MVNTDNELYNGTAYGGMAGFFKLYEPRFGAHHIHITADYPLRLDVAVTGSLQPFTRALARHPIAGLDVVNQRLEDIFIGYYGEQSA